jgi:TDG/mug DNA glycosylase family protein
VADAAGTALLNARHDRCFAPVEQPDATVLILGSLPGRRSLELQQYYAHPQNAFWKIVAQLFDGESSLPYARRLKVLTANGIALWDVLAAAERPGSLDSSIVPHSAVPNDFAAFFRAHPRIRRVYFNGQKAETLFRRRVLSTLGPEFAGMKFECLPSTSPAHAGMTFAKKLARWKRIKDSPE